MNPPGGYRNGGQNAVPAYSGMAYARGGRGIQDRLCEVFLKIGGSVMDNEAVCSRLMPEIAALAREKRILILPGGGQAVKRIKANQERYATHFHSCWIPAVLNLDVNAGLLASYSRAFSVISCAEEMAACFDNGNVAVFAAAGAVFNSLHLTPDFQATTDSMGLYFAQAFGARYYIIISDVDGIYPQRPKEGISATAIPRLTLEQLERLPSSKLDPSFPEYFRRYPIPTCIVNGKHPSRVIAAIRGVATLGTEITFAA